MSRSNADTRSPQQQASEEEACDCTPRLPQNWRALLAKERKRGHSQSAKHQWAYRNFTRRCFPKADVTDPNVRDQVEAWWVLTQLPRDAWRYWLTVKEEVVHD